MHWKNLLLRWLGPSKYLKLLSKGFFLAYDTGRLRRHPWYQCHYFVPQLIQPGMIVLDIGANLGYYSRIFAKAAGPKGKVLSVEPVPLYREVLTKNMAAYPQCTIVPYALGTEDKPITLGVPDTGIFRHGLTQVVNQDTAYSHTFQAEMRRGSALFANLQRLDYIKCDVEGYENVILPEMEPLFRKHHPVLQLETDGENRNKMIQYMTSLGYNVHTLQNMQLVELSTENWNAPGDLFFLPDPVTAP
jgi:FkbM family methyltransferase